MSRDDVFKAIDIADEEALRRLVEGNPALASSKSTDGLSAVLFTLYIAKYELTKILLEQEPDLSAFDLAALDWADELGALPDFDLNELSGDGFSALHLSCFFGALETAAYLVERGADVNIVAGNPSMLCPLNSASAGGHGPVVGLLLKAGADPNVRQAGGYTALMSAAGMGNAPVVDMLLDAGADRSLKSDDGKSAADFAVAAGFAELALKFSS